MAQADTYKTPYSGTYGSLAYDLTAEKFYPEETWREQEVAAPPVVEEEVRVQAVPRAKQSVAPMAILGFACAAVLLVFSLMARIQLIEVSDQTVQLQEQLAELELQQARLQIDYESAFNLTEIEEYAIGTLGMQKPRSDQVFYVDSSASDKAVILRQPEQESDLLDRFSDFLASIGEYLR